MPQLLKYSYLLTNFRAVGSLTDPNCPYPLKYDPDVSRKESPCVIPCPDPVWVRKPSLVISLRLLTNTESRRR